ncbi:MAG: helix-turn-helix domain-containing protein [Actinobacteria bacterium]|nr:helix-turn-helix domain-containing protein [Actinomycetota bacterium]
MVGELLRDVRRRAAVSQRELAHRAGTSGPTVAAYETAAKVPRADTLVRLLRAAGHDLTVSPARSRNDRFVDLLCERIAARVASEPGLLEDARDALPRLAGRSAWTDTWEALLDAGPEAVIGVLTSLDPAVRPLKTDTPLALVVDIDDAERGRVLEMAYAA